MWVIFSKRRNSKLSPRSQFTSAARFHARISHLQPSGGPKVQVSALRQVFLLVVPSNMPTLPGLLSGPSSDTRGGPRGNWREKFVIVLGYQLSPPKICSPETMIIHCGHRLFETFLSITQSWRSVLKIPVRTSTCNPSFRRAPVLRELLGKNRGAPLTFLALSCAALGHNRAISNPIT